MFANGIDSSAVRAPQQSDSGPKSQAEGAVHPDQRVSKRLKRQATGETSTFVACVQGPGHGSRCSEFNTPDDSYVASDAAAVGTSTLPSALMLYCLELLPPNELACSGRLAFKDAAQRFSSPANRTAHASQPLPDHVATTWPALQGNAYAALRLLTFKGKLHLLSRAATSGSETNMHVVWQLLRPGLFPELLPRPNSEEHYELEYQNDWDDFPRSISSFGPAGLETARACDPGTAAVRSGRVRLLRWMVAHQVPLVPNSTLKAAALWCSLEELQEAAAVLAQHYQDPASKYHDDSMWDRVAEFAAASRTPDAQAKMLWVMRASQSRKPHLLRSRQCICTTGFGFGFRGDPVPSDPTLAHAVSAAGAGNLPLLQWLRDHGCDVSHLVVLGAALEHAEGLQVADWLLDEAGCCLPEDRDPVGPDFLHPVRCAWRSLSSCAAASGSVEKLRWLAARGGGPVHRSAAGSAVERGHLEALQYLHAEMWEGGLELSTELFAAAAHSGRVEVAAWLRELGCPMDGAAYRDAVEQGHLGMVQWLAYEARCPGLDDARMVFREWSALTGRGGHVWRVSAAGGVAAGLPDGSSGSGGNGGGKEALRICEAAGCPWDGALNGAAAAGDLAVVQYLHEQRGFPFDGDTLVDAASSGCVALVEWLVRDKGCRAGPGVELNPHAEAGEWNDLAMLRCLQQLGVPWHRGVLEEAVHRDCRLPVLQWMVGHGAPAGREELHSALKVARRSGEEEVEEWRGSGRVCWEWLGGIVAKRLGGVRVWRGGLPTCTEALL